MPSGKRYGYEKPAFQPLNNQDVDWWKSLGSVSNKKKIQNAKRAKKKK